jgi:hypothetical protein
MASLLDWIDRIVRTPNHPMAWGRIPAGHVIGSRSGNPFMAHQDYVIVRLGSMFLKDSRVLWLKLSPLAHTLVSQAGRTKTRSETAVIGPTQFGDLATAPADRTTILNQRVAGPAVWRGGDLKVAAGLFAVPKDKAASALLDTVGQLSALAIPGLQSGLDIARIVKTGVESLLGLDGTKPILAVNDALGDPSTAPQGTGASPCVLTGIAAPASQIDFTRLWIRENRLWEGNRADALSPYEAHDHLLITIERGPAREDWRGLPRLLPHETALDTVLRDASLEIDVAKTRLNAAFAAFDADLTTEEDLTDPDKDRIRGEVIVELQRRLDRKFAGPFTVTAPAVERRSVGGNLRTVDPKGFDFLDVGSSELEGAKPAKAGALPF